MDVVEKNGIKEKKICLKTAIPCHFSYEHLPQKGKLTHDKEEYFKKRMCVYRICITYWQSISFTSYSIQTDWWF